MTPHSWTPGRGPAVAASQRPGSRSGRADEEAQTAILHQAPHPAKQQVTATALRSEAVQVQARFTPVGPPAVAAGSADRATFALAQAAMPGPGQCPGLRQSPLAPHDRSEWPAGLPGVVAHGSGGPGRPGQPQGGDGVAWPPRHGDPFVEVARADLLGDRSLRRWKVPMVAPVGPVAGAAAGACRWLAALLWSCT